jgi:methyl-accepting chemotaxis protein
MAGSGDAAAFQQVYLGDAQLAIGNATSALDQLMVLERTSGQNAASSAHATYRSARTIMIVSLIAGLIAAVLLSKYLAGLIVKPIRRVREVLLAVAKGDLTAEADIAQRDEVGAVPGGRQMWADRDGACAVSSAPVDLPTAVSPVSERTM